MKGKKTQIQQTKATKDKQEDKPSNLEPTSYTLLKPVAAAAALPLLRLHLL